MSTECKNVKISSRHHKILKEYCNKRGLKIYRVIEKWIETNCDVKKKDLYDE